MGKKYIVEKVEKTEAPIGCGSMIFSIIVVIIIMAICAAAKH